MFTVLVGLLLLFGIIGALVGPQHRVHDEDSVGRLHGDPPGDDDEQQQESDEDFLARERAAHYEDPYMPDFHLEPGQGSDGDVDDR